MEPWYKAVTPQSEVRLGRSFNPDEFAMLIPKLRSAEDLIVRVDFSATVDGSSADDLVEDLQQIRRDLALDNLRVERS